jgi:glycosyltransferase involved in cell wall biosynthesis
LKILVWQWSRFGGPPYFATLLAEALESLPGISVVLSLSRRADILRGSAPPRCEMPVETYGGAVTFALRVLKVPVMIRELVGQVRAHDPDLAICALPGPLDLAMATALRLLGVKFVVIVHDADTHPGDGYPLLMWLQRRLCRSANAVAALSAHVAERLRQQGVAGVEGRKLIRLSHPPFGFGVPPPEAHDGPLRLLFFGRLLPYKGIDLLAEALATLGSRTDLTVRVVGSGPDSPPLRALSRQAGVSVENRWVPDAEVGSLLGWADALVLPYREASQSGVAAAALAAGRSVVATRVGGLVEQLADAPRAILCDPTSESLAAALDRLLAAPYDAAVAGDPAAAWRAMAESLLAQTEALVPRARPDQTVRRRGNLKGRKWGDWSRSPPT